MKNNSRKKLNKAYENLFNRLYDLETVSINKIKELSIASDFFDVKTHDMSSLKDRVISMSKEIQNLEKSLEQAEKKISDMQDENDFLKEKNSLYVDKIFKFKSQGSKLIEEVEKEVSELKGTVIKSKNK